MKKSLTLISIVLISITLIVMGCQNPVDNSKSLSEEVIGMWEWLPNETVDYGETEFKEDLSMSRKINSVEYDSGEWEVASENDKTLILKWKSGFRDSVTISKDNLTMIKNNNGTSITLAVKNK